MKHDFSMLTKRLAKINFANTPITIMEFAKQANIPYNKGVRHFWKFVEYCQEKCQWYKNTSTTKQDFNTWKNLWNSFNKTNFASIDDFITDSGKKLQEKYRKILEKYKLDGFMEMSGCLTIEANDNYTITLGGKNLDDMSGWTISDNNNGKIYAEDSWENKDDNYIEKSIDKLYKECVTRFGKLFAKNIKEIAIELNKTESNFSEDEDDNWICSECGDKTDTIMTISEWCDEKGIDDNDRKYLENLSDKQHMNTDICEDCFNALVESSGIND